ncbi:Uncharacterised protein [Stutzerimonas stutzeri]|nr:Uncharacterised protein [Stutzerimonas stutzeri]CAB5537375.1 Uncharacterised protein [Stutzerimonas stutzeri]CAC9076304.1 Uncharacterised protein [Stutzerimonas stutzeri]
MRQIRAHQPDTLQTKRVEIQQYDSAQGAGSDGCQTYAYANECTGCYSQQALPSLESLSLPHAQRSTKSVKLLSAEYSRR